MTPARDRRSNLTTYLLTNRLRGATDMGKILLTCGGLGAGPSYSKVVDTVDMYRSNISTQGVQITISLDAYRRLVNWASMGRTFDGVLRALSGASSTAGDSDLAIQLDYAGEELADVRDALDECHQACRRHWGALPRG
jgi:hypothetical protein